MTQISNAPSSVFINLPFTASGHTTREICILLPPFTCTFVLCFKRIAETKMRGSATFLSYWKIKTCPHAEGRLKFGGGGREREKDMICSDFVIRECIVTVKLVVRSSRRRAPGPVSLCGNGRTEYLLITQNRLLEV